MTEPTFEPAFADEGTHVAEMLGYLGKAVQAHRDWLDRLNHALVCRGDVPEDDLAADAHRRCTFGQWHAAAKLSPSLPREVHERFEFIGREHERMHGLAREVLQTEDRGHPEASTTYLAFTDSVRQLGHAIEKLAALLQARFFAVDSLTGLLNRQAMYADLERLMPSIHCGDERVAVAMADIDYFKSINDTYGHAAGDLVLRSVAKTLLRQSRRGDQVYRFGGEELLLLLHDRDPGTILSLLEHLRRSVAELRTLVHGCGHLTVTVSFGVAWLEPGKSAHISIEAADRALYAAKAEGRNCVRWGALSPSAGAERGADVAAEP